MATAAPIISEAKMQEIADYLMGTCKAINEAQEPFELTEEQVEYLQDHIDEFDCFCCVEGCGWWHEESEMFDGNCCIECHQENCDGCENCE